LHRASGIDQAIDAVRRALTFDHSLHQRAARTS
jgi:hypothetical protein